MIYTIPNVPPKPPDSISPVSKQSGFARFIFLSRIVPNKGLKFAIEQLKPFSDRCELVIYGPKENEAYWAECVRSVGRLRMSYRGSVHPEKVIETLGQGHFLILPTWSENFSYVIYESLCAGCPVLISDQTPWRNLFRLGGGFDLPLNDPSLWQQAIKHCIEMEDGDYQEFREGAALRVHRWYRENAPALKPSYMQMFEHAASKDYSSSREAL